MQKQAVPPSQPPPQNDSGMQKLLTLLAILRQARHKKALADLGFVIVNQTFNVVPYRHCVFWRWTGGQTEIKAASGLVQVDPNGPYALWIKAMLGHLVAPKARFLSINILGQNADDVYAKAFSIGMDDCAPREREDWDKWASPHAMLVLFKNHENQVDFGMWIDRDEPFGEADTALIEELADGYAHVLHRLYHKKKKTGFGAFKRWLRPSKDKAIKLAIVAGLLMFFPVRMTVTAPAEVVASSPHVVTIPFDGIIEKVMVKPNQSVKKGDILMKMDGTSLRNKSELTGEELATAEAALSKTEREALQDPTKRTELTILKAQMLSKELEKKYADELLSRSEIVAGEDGIVIFSDASALEGKPAQLGEQVMLLADPKDSELLVRVPVDGMIKLDETVPARFFLNVTPLGFETANIATISYQASPDSDGLLTYKIRAKFAEGQDLPRVGWTGTAKLYGDKTILFFNVLRRPLVYLRRKTGI